MCTYLGLVLARASLWVFGGILLSGHGASCSQLCTTWTDTLPDDRFLIIQRKFILIGSFSGAQTLANHSRIKKLLVHKIFRHCCGSCTHSIWHNRRRRRLLLFVDKRCVLNRDIATTKTPAAHHHTGLTFFLSLLLSSLQSPRITISTSHLRTTIPRFHDFLTLIRLNTSDEFWLWLQVSSKQMNRHILN